MADDDGRESSWQSVTERHTEMAPPPMLGRKTDVGKRRWDLFPFKAARRIVDVMTFGAKKYEPNNWRYVDGWRDRYFAALMRHLDSWWQGEKVDPETGIYHLAHAGCCVMFLLELDDDDETKAEREDGRREDEGRHDLDRSPFGEDST